MLQKDYFKSLQNTFTESMKLVEKVPLGQVMYVIESRKAGMDDLIQTLENDIVKFKNENNDHMVDYCQNCIEKYQFAKEQFDSIYSVIKLAKI